MIQKKGRNFLKTLSRVKFEKENTCKYLRRFFNKNFYMNQIQISSFSSTSVQKNKENKSPSLFNTLILDSDKKIKDHAIVKNKEILLYYCDLPLLHTFKFHFFNLFSLFSFAAFIKINPLYLTFPAGLPIATFGFMYCALRYTTKMKHRKDIVEQIWYDQETSEIKIIFAKSLSPFKKERDISVTLDKIFPSSIIYRVKKNYKIWSEDVFPTTSSEIIKTKSSNLFNFWTKTFSPEKKFLMLYKFPQYFRINELLDVFNSKKLEIDYNNENLKLVEISSDESKRSILSKIKALNSSLSKDFSSSRREVKIKKEEKKEEIKEEVQNNKSETKN